MFKILINTVVVVGLLSTQIEADLLPSPPKHSHDLSARKHHKCAHDHIVASLPEPVTAPQEYAHHDGRALSTAARAAIRIKTDSSTVGDEGILTTAQVTLLRDTIIPTAISRVSELLKVDPVVGNLFASRSCVGYYTSGDYQGKCAGHSESLPVCDTATIPASMLSAGWVANSCTSSDIPASCDSSTMPAGDGVSDADFFLFVTTLHTSACPAEGQSGTLAYASSCQRDQNDRPTIGVANFCPYAVPTDASNTADVDLAVGTMIHEMFHALGFSSSSWPLFRDEAGDPLTPRHDSFPNTPSDDFKQTFTCSSSSITTYLPGTNVLDTATTDRGFPCSGSLDPSDCPHFFVTPKVVDAAREYFDCPTLMGPELENQPTSSCKLVGSHWEQRILEQEIMSPILTTDDLEISAITLALFEDSGWYTPDYSKATPLRKGSDWGYKQGCDFVEKPCLKDDLTSVGEHPHFCTDTSTAGSQVHCSLDRRAKAYCDATTSSTSPSAGMNTVQNSFGEYIIASGIQERDFCPAFLHFSSGDCTNTNNAPTNNYHGQVFGSDSYCAIGTLLDAAYVPLTSEAALCISVTCHSDMTATVSVDGSTALCSTTGQQVTFSGYSGYLECPELEVVCSEADEPYIPAWARPSVTGTPTVSGTPSNSPSRTDTPSNSPSISTTASNSPSISMTPSKSPSISMTASTTPSISDTPTPTPTHSITPTISTTPAPSVSPSISASASASPPPSQDCTVSTTFGAWSSCVGLPCAVAGTRVRYKTILSLPVGTGAACPDLAALVEVSACTLPTNDCSDTCDNGDRDNTETDVDCGGSTCTACSEGALCEIDTDCSGTAVCSPGGVCLAPVAETATQYVQSSFSLLNIRRYQLGDTEISGIKSAIVSALNAVGSASITASGVVVVSVDEAISSSRRRALQAADTYSTTVEVAVVTDTLDERLAGMDIFSTNAAALGVSLRQNLLPTVPMMQTVTVGVTAPEVRTASLVADNDSGDDDDGKKLFGVPILYIMAGAGVLCLIAFVTFFALRGARSPKDSASKYADKSQPRVPVALQPQHQQQQQQQQAYPPTQGGYYPEAPRATPGICPQRAGGYQQQPQVGGYPQPPQQLYPPKSSGSGAAYAAGPQYTPDPYNRAPQQQHYVQQSVQPPVLQQAGTRRERVQPSQRAGGY